jgi:hypothetical protein
MWKSAKAWLEFLLDKPQDAARDIIDATALAGTERMKDNARALMLYITAAQAKPSEKFESYLVDELEWLRQKYEGSNGDYFFNRVEYRLVHQVLFKRYEGQTNQLLALQNAAGTWGPIDIDTIPVEDVIRYLSYVNTPGTTTLDKYLKSRYQENDTTLRELIGKRFRADYTCLHGSELPAIRGEDGGIDLHPACVNHRHYVFPLPGGGLIGQHVKGSYGKERFPGTERKALGCGNAYAEAGV